MSPRLAQPEADVLDDLSASEVCASVLRAGGANLNAYRRGVLSHGVRARMAITGIATLDAYMARCERDDVERRALVDAIAINHSQFFRNPVVFGLLGQLLNTRRSLRVWSAGCAAGEEAYSVAIQMCQQLGEEQARTTVSIFGTDIDAEALAGAARGVYARPALVNVPLGAVDKYFRSRSSGYEIDRDQLPDVTFSAQDLLGPTPFPSGSVFRTFDLVMCRNVLIYFTRRKQLEVARTLSTAVAAGGLLVLGDSEALPEQAHSWFTVVDRRNGILQRNEE